MKKKARRNAGKTRAHRERVRAEYTLQESRPARARQRRRVSWFVFALAPLWLRERASSSLDAAPADTTPYIHSFSTLSRVHRRFTWRYFSLVQQWKHICVRFCIVGNATLAASCHDGESVVNLCVRFCRVSLFAIHAAEPLSRAY